MSKILEALFDDLELRLARRAAHRQNAMVHNLRAGKNIKPTKSAESEPETEYLPKSYTSRTGSHA